MRKRSTKSVRHTLLAGASCAGLLLASTAAMAQDASDGADAGTPADDENVIIVTGQKIERSLQDTVASVKVFNERTIDEQNFVELNDVLNQTANVSVGLDGTVITIRGNRNAGAGLGETTSDVTTAYIDGVFIPSQLFTFGGALNLWDVNSVEIFRGPQSTIQGRNALAGAIVINTVDPSNDFTGNAQLSYAEFDTVRGSAAVTLPIVEDLLQIRVAGDYTGTDGFISNPSLNSDEADATETVTARAKVRLTPSPGIEFIAGYTYIDADTGDDRVIGPLFPEQRITLEDFQTDSDARADIISLEGNFDIANGFSLTSVTSYIDNRTTFVFDPNNGPDPEGFPLLSGFSNFQDEIFSQELRFTYETDRFSGLLGLYYFDSSASFNNENNSAFDSDAVLPVAETIAGLLFGTPLPDPFQVAQGQAIRDGLVAGVPALQVTLANDSPTDIENYAIFGEFTYDLTDRLSITLGARYDDESIVQSINTATTVPALPDLGDPTLNAVAAILSSTFTSSVVVNDVQNDFDAFLPKGVITYEFTDDVSASVSVQRAYRAGGLSINQFLGALPFPGDPTDQEALETAGIVNTFEPEFTTNYEFAFRSQFADRRATFNANVFFIDYTDQQVTANLEPFNPLNTLTANAGASELFGFELEFAAQPVDELNLNLGFGYTETEFTEAVAGLGAFFVNDITGNEFSFAPEFTVNGGARYTHDSGFFANGRFRYTSDSFSLITNADLAASPLNVTNDDSFVVDLILGYEGERYGIEVFVTNLFNEEFVTGQFDEPAALPLTAIDSVSPPQQFGVRVTTNF